MLPCRYESGSPYSACPVRRSYFCVEASLSHGKIWTSWPLEVEHQLSHFYGCRLRTVKKYFEIVRNLEKVWEWSHQQPYSLIPNCKINRSFNCGQQRLVCGWKKLHRSEQQVSESRLNVFLPTVLLSMTVSVHSAVHPKSGDAIGGLKKPWTFQDWRLNILNVMICIHMHNHGRNVRIEFQSEHFCWGSVALIALIYWYSPKP